MYDPKDIYERSLKVVKEQKLIYIEDIVAWLGISKETFYRLIPLNSNESNAIRDAIAEQRIQIKVALRRKMYNANDTGQTLALYRLVATDKERRALALNYHEMGGDGITPITATVNVMKAGDIAEHFKKEQERKEREEGEQDG